MNYALIQGGIVINVIVWDGNTETWAPPSDVSAVLLPAGSEVGIGWSYDGANFAPPSPPSPQES
jgi:hypothetical protein